MDKLGKISLHVLSGCVWFFFGYIALTQLNTHVNPPEKFPRKMAYTCFGIGAAILIAVLIAYLMGLYKDDESIDDTPKMNLPSYVNGSYKRNLAFIICFFAAIFLLRSCSIGIKN